MLVMELSGPLLRATLMAVLIKPRQLSACMGICMVLSSKPRLACSLY
jgi:hypothetical protein